MADILTLANTLKEPSDPRFPLAWSEFLLNGAMVRTLTEALDTTTAQAILAAGQAWQREPESPWCTSKAFQRIYKLTGVPLVLHDFQDFVNCFLFALALLWDIDLPPGHLETKALEAALALAETFKIGEGTPPNKPLGQLRPELELLWKQLPEGRQTAELEDFLQGLPQITGLPMLGRSLQEATDIQQMLLKSLHLQAFVYDIFTASGGKSPIKELLQKNFHLTVQIHKSMVKEVTRPNYCSQRAKKLFLRKELMTAQLMEQLDNLSARRKPGHYSFRPFAGRMAKDGKELGSTRRGPQVAGATEKVNSGLSRAVEPMEEDSFLPQSEGAKGGPMAGLQRSPRLMASRRGRPMAGHRPSPQPMAGREGRPMAGPSEKPKAGRTHNALLSQVETPPSLVGEKWGQGSPPISESRCATFVAKATRPQAHDKTKVHQGHFALSKNLRGISGDWSCQKIGKSLWNQVFGPLVCHSKNLKWKRKNSASSAIAKI